MTRGRGHRLTREQRAKAIQQMATLIAGGATDTAAIQAIRDRFQVTAKTASRYRERVYAEWNRQARQKGGHHLSRALARRQMVMKAAMSRKKKQGDDEVADPDWPLYLAAAESEARILGLNAPTQVEIMETGAAHLMRAMIEAARRTIHDRAVLAAFVAELQRQAQEGLRRRPDLLPHADRMISQVRDDDEPRQIEAKVVDDKGQRNGHGGSNGHAPPGDG